MIKYHQNGLGNEYGEDHYLTNNWNPDVDYGNEYSNVYFRIDTPSYDVMHGGWYDTTNKRWGLDNRNAVGKEIDKIFTNLGWKCEERGFNGVCSTYTKGKSHLYMHPQDYSGEVLKSEIKSVAEAIEKAKTFSLRWVELYDTVYDMTDEEYETYLKGKDEEIRKALFETCVTTRKNKYFYAFDICRGLANQFRLRRVGLNDGRNFGSGQTINHIMNVIDDMGIEGLLFVKEKDGNKLVRTPNKTERRRLKICFE